MGLAPLAPGQTETGLTLEEAVPLGYALVGRLLDDLGARGLMIKGPILSAQGLRPPKVSVDVDVLVEPARFADLRTALAGLGWQDKGPYSGAFILPLHSATYHHPLWPCEIDVHDRFPGFFADPAVVFEALWQRRTTAEVAGCNVPCCDVLGNAAIAALHWLRDPQYDENQRRLEHMAKALCQRLDEDGRGELAELAAVTGAADTLRPLLDMVGAPTIGTGTTAAEDLQTWRLRTASGGMKSVPWLIELSRTPVRRWPRTLWRAATLTEREIRRVQPKASSGAWGLLAARGRRLSWGMRALPRAAALLWRVRHAGATS